MALLLLFLIGFLIGGVSGIVLMTILSIGKREDEIMEKIFKKI